MDRVEKYMFYIKNIILILMFFDIIAKYNRYTHIMLIYLTIFSILVINDFFRYSKFCSSLRQYTISIIASILISIILVNTLKGYADFYFVSLLYEIIVYYPGKWNKQILILHIFFYFLTLLNKLYLNNLSIEDSTDILLSFAFYFIVILLFYSFKIQKKERKRVEELNIELETKNKELREYSLRVEELTKSKERNRIAREIHDSLGHSLTALIMHLDYIEKVFDNDKTKAKDLIIKTQNIARDSINNLRNAVYALKDDNNSNNLTSTIEKMIKKLSVTSRLNVEFKHSGNIEDIGPQLKHTLFRIIQEALTNSVKHGKANKINVCIAKSDDSVNLAVKDNGIGCENIIKGNGLTGIEDRIFSLKGSIKYVSEENKGFLINVHIPLKEERTTYRKKCKIENVK